MNDKTLQIPETLKGKVLTQLVLQNAHENFILEFCESLVREDILLFNNIQLFPRAVTYIFNLYSQEVRFVEHTNFHHVKLVIKLFIEMIMLFGLDVDIFSIRHKIAVQEVNVQLAKLQYQL